MKGLIEHIRHHNEKTVALIKKRHFNMIPETRIPQNMMSILKHNTSQKHLNRFGSISKETD